MAIKHEKQWEFLKRTFEAKQLSHAYLFSGEKGIGKKDFANSLVDFIGCKFPDLMVIEPNERDEKFGDGGDIKIAKIRDVQNFLSYKSYNGGFKGVIIDEAEKMNAEAQNCFLKTLEEPKGDTVLFLITSRPDMLLATIFSRCQQVKFFREKGQKDSPELVKKEADILEQIIPVLHADFAEKFKYTKGIDFQKQSATEIIYVLQKYLRKDIIKNKKILELTEEISKKILFSNANPKLALEILLMEI